MYGYVHSQALHIMSHLYCLSRNVVRAILYYIRIVKQVELAELVMIIII